MNRKRWVSTEQKRIRLESKRFIEAARKTCADRIAKARALGLAHVDLKKRELAAERERQARVRDVEKKAKIKIRATIAELKAESDDAVERNLDKWLVPIFRKQKRHIAHDPGAQKSRTEAFLEWVEANEQEVFAALPELTEAQFAAEQAASGAPF